MRRAVAALFLFGISFGYVEAAVVVYLRAIYDPIRAQLHPERGPHGLFPLITSQELAKAGPDNPRRLVIEIGREAATMLMLATVAMAIARNLHQWMAAFAIVFGVWDISFYAFLKLMIHWPESLNTWDILFLIPLPWVGPIWAPVLVALSMIVCGLISLRAGGIRGGPLHWTGVLGGAADYHRRVRVGFSEHHGGRISESIQLAALSAGRGHRIEGVSGRLAARANERQRGITTSCPRRRSSLSFRLSRSPSW